jgi:hypothetical protein
MARDTSAFSLHAKRAPGLPAVGASSVDPYARHPGTADAVSGSGADQLALEFGNAADAVVVSAALNLTNSIGQGLKIVWFLENREAC